MRFEWRDASADGVLAMNTAGDANHDGQITVDEILTAVNNALNGCDGNGGNPSG